MTITASMVKELRERTGAGMMDCKKALQETSGDIEAAIEAMRKSGVAKAAKKSGRVAAEGMVLINQTADGDELVILEVNCETDFVAKDENFQTFTAAVGATALAERPDNLEGLAGAPLADGGGSTVEEARLQLVAKIGENVDVRRFHLVRKSGDHTGSYTHGTRIGVIVNLQGGDEELARDLAMHIAASRPLCVTEDEVPQELVDNEKSIFTAQAEDSGKPPEIIEKMVSGRIRKYLNEITLLGQPFVKDPDQSVAKLLSARKAQVIDFVRYEVGEGIEKKEDNFAEEVMEQAGISK